MAQASASAAAAAAGGGGTAPGQTPGVQTVAPSGTAATGGGGEFLMSGGASGWPVEGGSSTSRPPRPPLVDYSSDNEDWYKGPVPGHTGDTTESSSYRERSSISLMLGSPERSSHERVFRFLSLSFDSSERISEERQENSLILPDCFPWPEFTHAVKFTERQLDGTMSPGKNLTLLGKFREVPGLKTQTEFMRALRGTFEQALYNQDCRYQILKESPKEQIDPDAEDRQYQEEFERGVVANREELFEKCRGNATSTEFRDSFAEFAEALRNYRQTFPPPESTEPEFDYFPWTGEETVEEAAFHSLQDVRTPEEDEGGGSLA